MVEAIKKVERRGGKRYGPPRVALCGHMVPYFTASYRKRCDECSRRPMRACAFCGVDITDRRSDASTCSPLCRDIIHGTALIGPRRQLLCALPECDVMFEPTSLFAKCCSEKHGKRLYNRLSRADGRQPTVQTDRRRHNSQKRRALMVGAPTGGSVFLSEIIERDGTDCGICGEKVDLAVAYPNPFSKSVDHVVPLSRGGAHDPSNCQLAHLRCNIQKGAKVA